MFKSRSISKRLLIIASALIVGSTVAVLPATAAFAGSWSCTVTAYSCNTGTVHSSAGNQIWVKVGGAPGSPGVNFLVIDPDANGAVVYSGSVSWPHNWPDRAVCIRLDNVFNRYYLQLYDGTPGAGGIIADYPFC